MKSMMTMMSRKRTKMKPTPTTMKMKMICTVLNLVMKKRIKMAEKKKVMLLMLVERNSSQQLVRGLNLLVKTKRERMSLQST
jgi:hypothetical protein